VREYSEDTALQIDVEVRRIITECMDNARKILTAHVRILHEMAARLIEKESLDSEEIDAIVSSETAVANSPA
jgi:cell division protease FtsH